MFAEEAALRIIDVSFYPSIIAHEYSRLFELLESGQTYGALLQIKDVLEVMIKYPTLIAVSQIYQQKEEVLYHYKDIFVSLIEKPLSLGDWERIAGKVAGNPHVHKDIQFVLNDVLSIYRNKKYKIVNWRNEKIGHGALSFDVNDDFKKDIKQKLTIIKEHFEQCHEIYQNLVFYMKENQSMVVLQGKDKSLNLDHSNHELFVLINGQELNLYPFIVLNQHGIYLFDAYYNRKKRSALLNYPEGKKSDLINRVNEIFQSVHHTFASEITKVSAKRSVTDKTYSALEVKVIDKIQEVDDFVKPVHLKGWMKGMLENHNKGIFLLQMERGTGKTTFARSLDEQSIHKIELNDFSVRSYYINDTFRARVNNFITKMNDLLRQDADGEYIIEGISGISELAEDCRQAFADLLNEYQKEHESFFDKKKLLVIIDGLDEIPASRGKTIFDYLPKPEMLDEDVYLLYTCRTNNEISPFTKEKLKQIPLTIDPKIVFRDEKSHVDSLVNYIRKKVFHIEKDKQQLTADQQNLANEILTKTDGRFLYLKAAKELLTAKNENINSLPYGKDLFHYYLEQLQFLYGNKYFKNIIQLLSILATSKDALSIKEIAVLMGEERPTYQLLAYLVDLRGFLTVERSYRGNLFSVSHTEWKELLDEKYREIIIQIIEDWVNRIEVFEVGHINWELNEFDGYDYLFANLFRYIGQYNLKMFKERLYTEHFIVIMEEFVLELQDYKHEDTLKRAISIYEQILEIMAFCQTSSDEVADTLIRLGNVCIDLSLYERAEHIFTDAIKLMELLLKDNINFNMTDLAVAYANRGVSFSRRNMFNEAIADVETELSYLNSMMNDPNNPDKRRNKENLLLAHYNVGVIKKKCGLVEEAFEHFQEGVRISEEMLDLQELVYEENYCSLLLAVAGIDLMQKNLDEAEIKIEKAYEFMKQIDTDDISLIIDVISKRASLHGKRGNYVKQLEYVNRAIQLIENNNQLEIIDPTSQLEYFYCWKANALVQIDEQMEEALANYSKGIDLFEESKREGKLISILDLALSYHSRGELYDRKREFDKARNDYIRAIQLESEIFNEEDFKNLSFTAKYMLDNGFGGSYLALGFNYERLEDYQQSLQCYQRLIDIFQPLFDQGEHRFLDKLVSGYERRGSTYQELNNNEKAIEDFTKGIELFETYGNDDNNLENLLDCYLSRGAVYLELKQPLQSIADFSKAIEYQKQLLLDNEELDMDEEVMLALLYSDRAEGYVELEKMTEALNDIETGLGILNQLLTQNDIESDVKKEILEHIEEITKTKQKIDMQI